MHSITQLFQKSVTTVRSENYNHKNQQQSMQPNIKLVFSLAAIVVLTACGAKNDKAKQISIKQEKITKLKKQQSDIAVEIEKLETELYALDPSLAKEQMAKLVALRKIDASSFKHEIRLQGKIDAENTAYVAPPNGQGGVVTAVYVKQGQSVTKGQTLLQLDPMTLQQQIEPLRVQLETAKDVYNRRQNLWKQGIGSEVELISARTQVEALEKNIATLRKQISLFTVKAPESGIADLVNIRVGEMFVGTTAVGPQIRIVNTNNLKVVAQVPENYITKVSTGNPVTVYLPDTDKSIPAKISVTGKQIDPLSRSFYVEAKLPVSKDIKPNQIAVVKIQDYAAANTITIPVNTLQNDEKGKYVMVAVQEKGKLVARKKPVQIGMLNNDELEITAGLNEGDMLVTEGFQNLYDGQYLTTSAK